MCIKILAPFHLKGFDRKNIFKQIINNKKNQCKPQSHSSVEFIIIVKVFSFLLVFSSSLLLLKELV
jgi:hypothetical protein